MLAYGTLMEGADPVQRADLDAYLEGREMPSVIRARAEAARAEVDEKEARRGKVAQFMAASKRIDRRAHR